MRVARPVLVLQLRPEDDAADSEYACFLKVGGLREADTRRIRVDRHGIPGDLDVAEYSAVIVGGSPFDISTPENSKSQAQKDIEGAFSRLLDQVVPRDIPFLGACSGNGLLGSYLGARISTRFGETIGCVTVSLTDEGARDPLLAGFPAHIDVLLGHKEAVDATPDGAVLLVTGSACPVQMFRVGANVYATQFHPEADAEEFALRIDVYRHHGYFEPHEADALKTRIGLHSTPYAQEILRRFVGRYCR